MKSKDKEKHELQLAQKILGKTPEAAFKGRVIDVLNNLNLEEHFDIHHPPLINKYTSLEAWAKGTDHFVMPNDADNIYLQPIREDGKVFQYVGYVRHDIPDEDHDDMHESFFILEGTCTLMIDHKEFQFGAGDYFELPLHSTHSVRVTSTQPLKAVLQRIML